MYHGGLVGGDRSGVGRSSGGGHSQSHSYVYDKIGLVGLATRAGQLESQPPSLNKICSTNSEYRCQQNSLLTKILTKR